MDCHFSDGDRVRVSEHFFWARGAAGTVAPMPPEVKVVSGDPSDEFTREEYSALGVNTVYWVWFDEPQFDADGDGPYRAGQIWRSALSRLIPN